MGVSKRHKKLHIKKLKMNNHIRKYEKTITELEKQVQYYKQQEKNYTEVINKQVKQEKLKQEQLKYIFIFIILCIITSISIIIIEYLMALYKHQSQCIPKSTFL